MDSFVSFCSVDDFLNFPSDIEDQNPQQEKQNQPQNYQKQPQNSSKSTTHQIHLSMLDGDEDSFPGQVLEEEEEDLEWLNESRFPPLEALIVDPLQSPKHQSPVSVLESGVGGCGFRVPGRARSRMQRRRRVGAPTLFGLWGGGVAKNAPEAEPRRRCRHCLAEKTPQWRAGPHGPKTLCNACGVRYKAGRLVPEYRPASSPTFSSEMHSNSHRKILEMRRKKQKVPENG